MVEKLDGGGEPRIFAVAVTYRRPVVLRSTLQALASQTRPPEMVLIVDNDPECSARDLAAEEQSWCYLPTGDNVGPAGGLAAGVGRLLEVASDDDWVLFVDDDDPPSSETQLEELFALGASARSEDPKLGAVGFVGGMYDRRKGRTTRLADSALTGHIGVDWIAGGQLPLYSVEALRQIGPPDRSLFFGFDDLEYGLRLRRSDWRLVVDGASWHELRQKAGRLGISPAEIRRTGRASAAWRVYYSNRNLLLISRTYAQRGAIVFVVAQSAKRMLRALLTPSRRSQAPLIVRGVIDGLRGRSGRIVSPE